VKNSAFLCVKLAEHCCDRHTSGQPVSAAAMSFLLDKRLGEARHLTCAKAVDEDVDKAQRRRLPIAAALRINHTDKCTQHVISRDVGSNRAATPRSSSADSARVNRSKE
jgi:hypothetical protein